VTSTPPALSAPATAAGRSAGSQRVLDAALELFSEHGFEGTSLQDIADRLGVTKAAVYYHFRTKDDLLLALVLPVFHDVLALVAEAASRPARSARTLDVGGYVEVLLRHRRVAAYLTRDATAMTRAAVMEQATQVRERTEAMLVGEHPDDLGAVWGAALMQALAGGLLAAPADAPDEWLREELTELGTHLLAGYRKAVRRREA
jgi:AcrR family transcriptional regulator